MDNQAFDAFVRHAAGAVSRRGSLLALGSAGLAVAIAKPQRALAGKAGKKAKRKCQQQKGQCLDFYTEFCEGNTNCEESYFSCCEFLAQCHAGEFLECIASIV